MNLKILVPELGTIRKPINFKGGEIDLEELAIPRAFNSNEAQLRRLSSKELKVLEEEITTEIKKLSVEAKECQFFFGGEKRVFKTKKELFSSIKKEKEVMINKRNIIRKILKQREPKPYWVRKLHVDSALSYEIDRMNPSMIKPDMVYEMYEGVNMSLENELVDDNYYIEMTIDGKLVIKEIEDKTLLHKFETPYKNNGDLKIKDLISLYFSGRLGISEKGKFISLIEKIGIKDEKILVPVILYRSNILWVRIRKDFIPLSQLKRKTYSLRDRSDKEISFLLNLKGEATKVGDCSYYDEEREDNPLYDTCWVDLKALSYNMLDYEKNYVVVLAGKSTLEHVDNRVQKLHEEFEYYKTKKGEVVHNPKGLTSNEENSLESIRKEKFGFDESEIEELFDILQEIDGRQSLLNIEHDIRNHYQGKYLLQKTSKELFFLKIILEDAVYGTEQLTNEIEESEEDEEVFLEISREDYFRESQEVIGKRLKKISDKKIKALINVISGLHLRYEDEEELGKYLSDELDEIDKVNHDRKNNHYKTHRNYYSQTEGVLAPNGDPQTTHKRRNNPPSMRRIRALRKEHKNVLRGKYSGVSNPAILSEIYDGLIIGCSYPYELRKALGAKGVQSDEIIDDTFEEIEGYLSEDIKRMYWLQQVKTSFKHPIKETELDVCNNCLHEGECFVEKCKRISEKRTLTKYFKETLGLEGSSLVEMKKLYKEMEEDIPSNDRLPGRKPIKVKIFNEREDRVVLARKNERRRKNKSSPLKGGNTRKIKVDGQIIEVYVKGDASVLDYPSVSFAGGREPSEETLNFIREKVDEFSDEYVIVSGLALGCDTEAHNRCIKNKGITIAVLPCGFNHITPASNKKLAKEILDNGGLLISEYRPETRVKNDNYLKRNKIIAGISDKVVICKGGNGTASTRRSAIKQRKEILVQPSS